MPATYPCLLSHTVSLPTPAPTPPEYSNGWSLYTWSHTTGMVWAGVCPTGESQSVVAGVTEPSQSRRVVSVVGEAIRAGCETVTLVYLLINNVLQNCSLKTLFPAAVRKVLDV